MGESLGRAIHQQKIRGTRPDGVKPLPLIPSGWSGITIDEDSSLLSVPQPTIPSEGKALDTCCVTQRSCLVGEVLGDGCQRRAECRNPVLDVAVSGGKLHDEDDGTSTKAFGTSTREEEWR